MWWTRKAARPSTSTCGAGASLRHSGARMIGRLTAFILAPVAAQAGGLADVLDSPPPQAHAACYVQRWVPPVTDTVTVTRPKSFAYTANEYVPPVTGQVARRVLVRPEIVEWHVVPARFETRRVRTLVTPERRVWEERPAITEQREVGVLVTLARVYYRHEVHDGIPVKVRCEDPAVYRTEPRTVLVEPARRVSRVVPAVFRDEIESVMVAPERRERRVIPAVWRDEFDQGTVIRGQVVSRQTPATSETVTRQVVLREGRYIWERLPHCR